MVDLRVLNLSRINSYLLILWTKLYLKSFHNMFFSFRLELKKLIHYLQKWWLNMAYFCCFKDKISKIWMLILNRSGIRRSLNFIPFLSLVFYKINRIFMCWQIIHIINFIISWFIWLLFNLFSIWKTIKKNWST